MSLRAARTRPERTAPGVFVGREVGDRLSRRRSVGLVQSWAALKRALS